MILQRQNKKLYQSLLGLALGASLLISGASSAIAQSWPDRPLSIVVPAGTGGTNDRAARLMARFISEELGQPVTVVNRPGGGNMLGHLYFNQQPADGYTLMRTTSMPYMTMNQLAQGADFEIDEFHPLNLSDFGVTVMATSNNSRFETVDQVLAEIRARPGRVTIGVQPTSTDMINFMVFLEKFGLTRNDVRIVTYDSGGPVRNGIVGGQFDIGMVGDQGMHALRGQFRPLLSFTEEAYDTWDAPHVVGFATKEGVTDYSPVLSGSIQGYFVHTKLMEAYPDRYARLVQVFDNISKNPEAIKAHNEQGLGIKWMGPDRSRVRMLLEHEALGVPEILEIVSPK